MMISLRKPPLPRMSRYALAGAAIALLTLPGLAMANSLGHSGRAAEHSALALGHAAAGTVTGVSAAVALPLMAVGEVGQVAGNLGEVLWEGATRPLDVSGETVTAARTEPVEPPPSARR